MRQYENVKFFGENREKQRSYYIPYDSLEAASIGSYLVDGAEKQIYIETEEPSQFDTLAEEEKYLAYVYMDTVNDVITAIMESEHYVGVV